MKTTYEKVTFKKLSKAFKVHEKSPLYFDSASAYLLDDVGVVNCFNKQCHFYQKVEVKEPQKTVVDAVNYYEAEVPRLYVDHYMDAMNSYYICFKDDEFFPDDVECNDIICTKEEFNQCVEDMAEYSWNPNCKFRNYEAYKEVQIDAYHEEALRENMAYDLYVISCKATGIKYERLTGLDLTKLLRMIDLGVTVNKGE